MVVVKIKNYFIGIKVENGYLIENTIPLPKDSQYLKRFGKIDNKFQNFGMIIYKLYIGEIDNFEALNEINYKLNVTNLTRKILDEILNIKRGDTITYGELGKKVNTSPRVVGFLLNKNPLPLLYPCHRVVGKKDIGGYKFGRNNKLQLLIKEGAL